MIDMILDIGGTSIKIVSLTYGKKEISNIRYTETPFPNTKDFSEDIFQIKKSLTLFLNEEIRRLVICFPGVLRNNKIFKWPNKTYWEGNNFYNFVKILNPKEWLVFDDCTLGVLSNLLLYPNKQNSLFINVGSGIGCGLIINGQLFVGDNGNAGELGHITVFPESTITCPCGNRGCLQLFSSGKGILERAKMVDNSLSEYKLLQECLGNNIVKKKIKEGAELLGQYISNMINFLDVTTIHINGGVTNINEYNETFIDSLYKQEKKYLDRELTINIRPYFNASLVGGVIKMLGKEKLEQVSNIINNIENKMEKVE
ncbi:ROK family protein [Cytobacillus kochii]|uniref:ROK family protein n=1 Tax=Cytobacillus kochii TaxID=859143 RepID=UPI001CD515C1|nr:ROK family protein [Cytobacillus kochii]MCA1028620.1 ROK family protein [Cytobacillus kochii]